MAELWDEIDKFGNPTGRIVEKKYTGFYHPVVDIWIFNSEGKILLQKRADTKRVQPGVWAETGGSVMHGETSLEAIHREVKEELGVDIDDEACDLLMKFRSGYAWGDHFFLRQDFDLDQMTLQADEVTDVGWFTTDEIDQLVENGEFIQCRWEFVREVCRLYAQGINISDISWA